MPSTDQINVFIPSGAGAPGFAGIVKCLRADSRIRIFSGDVNPHAYGQSLSDHFMQTPSSQSAEYVKFVLEMCLRHNIHVVLPITTAELEPLSRNAADFIRLNIRLVVNEILALETANNKGKLYHFLKNHDSQIPLPEFEFAIHKSDFEKATELLLAKYDEVCFKPLSGNGSRGFGRVTNSVTDEFLSSKASVLPMTIGEWMTRLPDTFQTPLLISKYLVGKEYSVDLLCDHGKIIVCIPRTRDKMIGGISVAGTFENNFTLKAFCMSLVNALNLNGPVGIQWREDENGMPHLLEINPRLQGTTSACLLAGVNLPLMAVRQAIGEDLGLDGIKINWGTKFSRYWTDAGVQ